MVVAAVLLGLVWAVDARACSCAPTAPAESLASADTAIVGELLDVQARGPSQAAYRYRVLRVYRGGDRVEAGERITVLSPRGSASCGLPKPLHRHYGLFLIAGGGRWASGLCGVISPRRLWTAAHKPGGSEATRSGAGFGCTS
jgi:tissue inhibitor of metalloproteinase